MLTATEAQHQTEQLISSDRTMAREMFESLLNSGDEDAVKVLSAITSAIRSKKFVAHVTVDSGKEKLIREALAALYYGVAVVTSYNKKMSLEISWKTDV